MTKNQMISKVAANIKSTVNNEFETTYTTYAIEKLVGLVLSGLEAEGMLPPKTLKGKPHIAFKSGVTIMSEVNEWD